MNGYQIMLQEAARYANDMPYGYSADMAITSHGFWLEVTDRRRLNHCTNRIVPFDDVGKLTDNMDQMVQSLRP